MVHGNSGADGGIAKYLVGGYSPPPTGAIPDIYKTLTIAFDKISIDLISK